jgi:hypothetical protein
MTDPMQSGRIIVNDCQKWERWDIEVVREPALEYIARHATKAWLAGDQVAYRDWEDAAIEELDRLAFSVSDVSVIRTTRTSRCLAIIGRAHAGNALL